MFNRELVIGTAIVASMLLGCGGGGGGGAASGGGTGGDSGATPPRYSDSAADPIGDFLWHLKNIGQTGFLSLPSSGTSGTDIN